MFEQVPGNDKDSILISFATKSSNAGQVTSKLHVIELGAQAGFYKMIDLIILRLAMSIVFCTQLLLNFIAQFGLIWMLYF